MASDMDNALKEFITSVEQRPEWGPDNVERQMVRVYFTTLHGFNGQVKMTLAEWGDAEMRNQKLIDAIATLEGPFWEVPEESKKKGK